MPAGRPKGARNHVPELSKTRMHSIVDRIEAIKLIDRLTRHAMNEIDMTPSQVQAAKILLDKAVSNAPTRTEVSGADGGDIPLAIRVIFGAAQ